MMEPLLKRVLFRDEVAAANAAAKPATDGAFAWVLEAKLHATDALFGTIDKPLDPAHAMGVLFALIAGFALLAAVSEYLFNWLSRRVALDMVIDMRMRLARHLLSLSMRYHGERRFGDLLSRISSDVNTTLGSVNVMLKDCVQLPLLVLGSLLAAFLTAPLPTLSVVLVLPLIAVPIAILGGRVRNA